MKPWLIAAGVVAAWVAAGVGVAWCVGKAVNHSDAERAEEDAAQAEWLRLMRAHGVPGEDRGRVPVLCAGDCGMWRWADELINGRCSECTFRYVFDRLLPDE